MRVVKGMLNPSPGVMEVTFPLLGECTKVTGPGLVGSAGRPTGVLPRLCCSYIRNAY